MRTIRLAANKNAERDGGSWAFTDRLQTPRDLGGVFSTIEGGDANEPFATRSETATGSNDNIQFLQHPIEHLPTSQTGESANPDVRSVHAAIDLHTDPRGCLAEDASILHVMTDQSLHLSAPFRRINSFRPALHRVTHAVRFRAPPPLP